MGEGEDSCLLYPSAPPPGFTFPIRAYPISRMLSFCNSPPFPLLPRKKIDKDKVYFVWKFLVITFHMKYIIYIFSLIYRIKAGMSYKINAKTIASPKVVTVVHTMQL